MRSFVPASLTLLLACAVTTGGGQSSAHGDEAPRRSRSIPAIERCDATNECVVQPRTCCGRCGAAVSGDAVAVNAAETAARASRGEPICEGNSSCPDCYQEPSTTLAAVCRAHRCTLVDLETSPLTACRRDDDCALTFAGCCACGSPGAVAVGRTRVDDYRRTLCGPGPTACPQCVGRAPTGLATCVAGHCNAPPFMGDD